MDHGLFQPQMEHFSSHYQVISWDVPAHGLSRPYEDFSLQSAANELAQILEAENINKAHLVGQSMGGYIIQIVALDHPDRVLTLTAVDSSPIQPSYYSALDNWLLSITPSLLQFYPYNTLINTIAKQIAITKLAQYYALETLKGLTKAEISNIMREVYQGLKVYKRDFRLPFPLLIVYGESDHTGKVQSYCDRWATQEKRALQIIPDAAHNSNMDNPVDFNRILDEFLATGMQ
jgi:pimeloyl-ACP methyl ester carboxylesterase